MAIVGVLMGAIYGIFVSSNRSYHTQDRVTEAQQGLRVGLDFMVRDIRMAGFDPLGTVNAGFEVANATKLRITSDTNMANGIEEIDRERITYEFDAVNKRLRQCLYEGTPSETWQTLIDNVNALAFTYLDANDNVTGTLADITTVLISMTCEGTNVQGQTFLRTLNTRVRCRNL
jgi:type IV pilus assembly protein PilW